MVVSKVKNSIDGLLAHVGMITYFLRATLMAFYRYLVQLVIIFVFFVLNVSIQYCQKLLDERQLHVLAIFISIQPNEPNAGALSQFNGDDDALIFFNDELIHYFNEDVPGYLFINEVAVNESFINDESLNYLNDDVVH